MSPRESSLFRLVPSTVRIVEVGPRDGLQNEAVFVPTAKKIAFVDALSDAGHTHIEVTSFVSPRRVPQLADAGDVFRGIRKSPGTTYTALVPNEEGLQRSLAAGARSIAVFTAASETFNRKNIGCSIDESIQRIAAVLRAAPEGLRVRGYVSTAFVCPYEGTIDSLTALDVILRLRSLGIEEISIGDTLGAAWPDQVSRLLEAVDGSIGLRGIALHLHDTHRRALLNALVGLLHGVEEFDSSAGGLGGCPFAPGAKGNVATEELVALLHGMGISTGIDIEKERAAAERIRQVTGSLMSTPTPGSPSAHEGGSPPGER